ncbi:unnamed protein product [Staurois parvus]|uniref:Transposase n=1 Tax=Staurois parvus TaxID=386267 RepID=A0ABN9A8P7_9NEOB|nr:unnamed protein product [Staurois parvus]
MYRQPERLLLGQVNYAINPSHCHYLLFVQRKRKLGIISYNTIMIEIIVYIKRSTGRLYRGLNSHSSVSLEAEIRELQYRARETVQHFQKERFITKRSNRSNKNIYRTKM